MREETRALIEAAKANQEEFLDCEDGHCLNCLGRGNCTQADKDLHARVLDAEAALRKREEREKACKHLSDDTLVADGVEIRVRYTTPYCPDCGEDLTDGQYRAAPSKDEVKRNDWMCTYWEGKRCRDVRLFDCNIKRQGQREGCLWRRRRVPRRRSK